MDAPAGLPVSVHTRFDRFPATIKGALVLRGADPNPHRVQLLSADIARVPSGPTKPIPMGDLIVDVAPARDLFLPFEVAISDLDPGWYAVRSEILVDGGASFVNSGRAFSIPWPRGEVRTGTLQVQKLLKAGERSFRVERIELRTDRTAVVWREEPLKSREQAEMVEPATLVVRADGEGLPEVPEPDGAEARPGSERRSTAYPVPKSVGSIGVVVRADGAESPTIEVAL